MRRIIGIDFGTKRTGIAVTDPLGLFASPMETVRTADFDSFIDEYLKKEQVEAFVVGYPVRLNNERSETVKYVDLFIKRLKKRFPGCPVHLIDERFTSRIAVQSMVDGGLKKKKRQNKALVDKISASLILQSFLDHKSGIKKL